MKNAEIDSPTREMLLEYLLRLADDRLILGQRLSEWCGHGPFLEEDLALANFALDLIGQANFLLEEAAALEGKERTADELAFFREAEEFRNLNLVEQPNGDFGDTIARQFLFDAYSYFLMEGLSDSKYSGLAAIAAKTVKEDRYHLRHSREWVLRLGDGTEESRQRIQASFDNLWTFSGEIFEVDDVDQFLSERGFAVDLKNIRPKWTEVVNQTLIEATLTVPDSAQYMQRGGRKGLHTEHLGHLLSKMQVLPRSYPDAKW